MTVPLEKLFGSRTRVKLLSLFTGGVKRPYYVRELARITGERVNSIRREVDNLRRIGLLSSHLRRGKKFYVVNPAFPLLEELSKLTLKGRKAIEDRLFEGLRRVGNIRLVLLAGFFTQSKTAPTDILIVGTVREPALAQCMANIEEELGREINYTTMSVTEYEYRQSLNDQFLRQVLDARPIELVNTLTQHARVPAKIT